MKRITAFVPAGSAGFRQHESRLTNNDGKKTTKVGVLACHISTEYPQLEKT